MAQPTPSADAAEVDERLTYLTESGELNVPLMPRVASEIMASAARQDADAPGLARLLAQDQPLTAHVFRAVNSPAYRGVVEIRSLTQAIARLGMVRMRQIALAACLSGVLVRDTVYRQAVEREWRLGLRSALFSRDIARRRQHDGDAAYTAGLLHNVGTFMLLNLIPAVARRRLTDSALVWLLERHEARIGALVAERWHLPEYVATVIRSRGVLTGAGADADLIAIVSLGRALATSLLDGTLAAPSLATRLAAREDARHLHLCPLDLDELVAAAADVEGAATAVAGAGTI